MDDTRSNDNVLNQRLKNRQRQSRYRARKRLEADYPNADTSITVARAFIFKQEAQREEVHKQLLQVVLVNDASRVHLLLHLRGESPFGSGLHGTNCSSQYEIETTISAPIRRKWKAEARNKTK